MNPGHTHDSYPRQCSACETTTVENAALTAQNATLRRSIRFLGALRRVQRTGSPAGRAELRDARLDMEAHGESHAMFDLAEREVPS